MLIEILVSICMSLCCHIFISVEPSQKDICKIYNVVSMLQIINNNVTNVCAASLWAPRVWWLEFAKLDLVYIWYFSLELFNCRMFFGFKWNEIQKKSEDAHCTQQFHFRRCDALCECFNPVFVGCCTWCTDALLFIRLSCLHICSQTVFSLF